MFNHKSQPKKDDGIICTATNILNRFNPVYLFRNKHNNAIFHNTTSEHNTI